MGENTNIVSWAVGLSPDAEMRGPAKSAVERFLPVNLLKN